MKKKFPGSLGLGLFFPVLTAGMTLLALPSIAGANDQFGRVTNLPIPRFVSLKAQEANVRRGPSLTHQIDWKIKGRGLPLLITAEYGHWRRIQDRDGEGGWIHYALLSGTRHVLVTSEISEARRSKEANSGLAVHFEKNVIAELLECAESQCRITAGGFKGWVSKNDIWGVGD